MRLQMLLISMAAAAAVALPAQAAPDWPAVAKARPLVASSVRPDPAVFARIATGATKTEVYRLLGHPHYREGAIGVHEWDYAFQLPDLQGGHSTCQYKVLFGDEMTLSQTVWNPASCAALLQPPAAPAATTPKVVGTVDLPADVLFAFDSARLAPDAAVLIDGRVLEAMRATGATGVRVIGYADRLGGDAYNRRLSLARAESVKAYLVEHGVAGDAIATEGRGASEPVAQCEAGPRPALAACLQPDRRVRMELSKD